MALFGRKKTQTKERERARAREKIPRKWRHLKSLVSGYLGFVEKIIIIILNQRSCAEIKMSRHMKMSSNGNKQTTRRKVGPALSVQLWALTTKKDETLSEAQAIQRQPRPTKHHQACFWKQTSEECIIPFQQIQFRFRTHQENRRSPILALLNRNCRWRGWKVEHLQSTNRFNSNDHDTLFGHSISYTESVQRPET